MSKPIAQIKTTGLFGDDGPRILRYPDGIYLTEGGQPPHAERCAADDAEEDAGQGKPRI